MRSCKTGKNWEIIEYGMAKKRMLSAEQSKAATTGELSVRIAELKQMVGI
jgi:hypothetical protein